jgi:hypothetical protein
MAVASVEQILFHQPSGNGMYIRQLQPRAKALPNELS